jgi:serine/threonine protein kinase
MLRQEPETLSGQPIGNYELVKRVATRKVSDLYLARDIELQHPVYLEMLRSTADEDQDLAARFQRRMESVRELKHENIASVSDIDVTEESLPYAVMEYFPARTLAERLAELRNSDEQLSVIEALRLVQQIAQALSVAHAVGLVHHDLRPENILLREDGTPVLLDLGVPIVVAPDSVLNNADGEMLHYASPEELEGKTIGRRSNIYSLGVILYELLAGHRPKLPTLPYDIFPQANMPKEEPLEEAREGLAGETYRLVRNCLWRQEWSRYETTEEVITAIETAILAEQELPKTPAWTGGRRRSLYAFLLPAVIIALIVVGFLAVRGLGGNRNGGEPEPTVPGISAQGIGGSNGTPTIETPGPATAATSTTSPFGDTIIMVAPIAGEEFTRNDRINFIWYWLNVPNPGAQFTVYILEGEEEHALEPSLTEPNEDTGYRLTIDAGDIPAETSELAWQVRLEEAAGGEVIVASNTVPFVIIANTATPTPTPSVTPTDTATPTATASPTVECVVSPPPSWVVYLVQGGDSVSGLAESRGTSAEFVMEVNCLEDAELSVNQRLYLPPLPATATLPPTATVPPAPQPITPTPTSDSGGGGGPTSTPEPPTSEPPVPTATTGPPTEIPEPTEAPSRTPPPPPPP